MKKFVLFSIAALFCLHATGQNQAETFIKEAQDFLAKKEYKQAMLSLQDAINDINMMVAKQVADSLPAEINGLKAEGESEISAAGMGMMGGGMQIIKRYRNETKTGNDAEVQILANSPMLTTMNMYLTNPSMLGPGYKSVRIGSNRAIAKTDMQDDGSGTKTRSTEIQVPLGQTLLTVRTNGFATEQDELAFATKLKLDKIKEALGE
jgi:hypothetical protein